MGLPSQQQCFRNWGKFPRISITVRACYFIKIGQNYFWIYSAIITMLALQLNVIKCQE